MNDIERLNIDELQHDPGNPREADEARDHILGLSLAKLGFVLPLYVTRGGLILSGHQRHRISVGAGRTSVPCVTLDVDERHLRGVNLIFNRTTNDFGALDTGSSVQGRLQEVLEAAQALDDFEGEDDYAYACSIESIRGLAHLAGDRYDKKGVVAARQLAKLGIHVPIVLNASGTHVINGAFRLFYAREQGMAEYPVIRIPDDCAEVAGHFLNYLSMDFRVDEQFADLLRYSAYRRPQNNRGRVPKAYRFWGNGERTLLDRDSYSKDYWRNFREIHGNRLLDFGSGLSKAAPYLRTKGFDAIDFEPYRCDTDKAGTPDIDLSRREVDRFLDEIADPEKKFDSIFMASVLNSIPFPRDRMAVLAIVHALCSYETVVYGTCRDISDYHYEYAGIRQASYFVFDSEYGVRLGDSLTNPKIQKFQSEEQTAALLSKLWAASSTWPGGNVHYWRAKAPKRSNPRVLRAALEFEFDLPYADGSRMGLVDKALQAFANRLGVSL